MTPSSTSEARDPLTAGIIAGAIEVHRFLGPGLLEAAYESCLAWELRARGFAVEQQVALPVVYKGVRMEVGFRIDLLVAESVIVEVKSVEKLSPLTDAQVLTYLKLSTRHTALVCNFNVHLMKDGIRRLVL
jgi:GxxExxY protein